MTIAETPRKPCDAMTIKSHPLLFAVSIIASYGWSCSIGTKSHATPDIAGISHHIEIFRCLSRDKPSVLIQGIRNHYRVDHQAMERRRHNYCGDFCANALCEVDAMLDGIR
jgi:hypothetical protein